jgi:hypothetical protein
MSFKISPEYFQAAGSALVAGRSFNRHDDRNAPGVAIINRQLARKIFGSENSALGRYFKLRDGGRIQVAGIAEDGKYETLTEEPRPAIFLPLLQSPAEDSWLVIRSGLDPQPLAAAIRAKFRELDAELPLFITTWTKELDGALFVSRVAAVTLGVMGAIGAMLSITGIFGMAAYSVSKRMRELGIRMALGAQRKEVLQAGLGRAFQLLAFGSAAGLVVGMLSTRVLAAIVFQATPRDPAVLGGVVAAMVFLGLLATWIPARRALTLDPAKLLREE